MRLYDTIEPRHVETVHAIIKSWALDGKQIQDMRILRDAMEDALQAETERLRAAPAAETAAEPEPRCSTCGKTRDGNRLCSNSFHVAPEPAPGGEWTEAAAKEIDALHMKRMRLDVGPPLPSEVAKIIRERIPAALAPPAPISDEQLAKALMAVWWGSDSGAFKWSDFARDTHTDWRNVAQRARQLLTPATNESGTV